MRFFRRLKRLFSRPGPASKAAALFDADWYLASYKDVAAQGVNPLEHFLTTGYREGYQPSLYFDTAYYLAANEDVARAGLNPLVHYAEFGEKEGRQPGPLFDPAWYREVNGLAANESALAHYLRNHKLKPLSPVPEFDTGFYLASDPNPAKPGIDVFQHYVTEGWKEGRNPSNSFDSAAYAARQQTGNECPLVHFLRDRYRTNILAPDWTFHFERLYINNIFGRVTRKSGFIDAITFDVITEGKQKVFTHSLNAGDNHNISFPLITEVCDGLPHLFAFIDRRSGRTVTTIEEIIPDEQTPWDFLVEYGGPPVPIERSPAAAFRYRSLAAQIENLSGLKSPSRGKEEASLKQIALAHRLVTDGFQTRRSRYPILHLPKLVKPRCSIIIPVHNQFAVTYNCIAAIILAYNKASFEVIVVDDGSSDETVAIGDVIANIRVVRHETARGFGPACNAGAAAAKGEYLVFLNNDTEVTSGWLDEQLFCFERMDRVGLTGSRLLYPDGKLQEAGGIVWNTGDPWNYGHRANPSDPRFSYTREADYVSGASLMLPRKLWKAVGGFSTEFAPAYFEDTDLALKIRQAGHRVVYVPLSRVYHFEGLSHGRDVSEATGLKRFQEINRPKFKAKWRDAFRNNGAVGVNPDLTKDRGIIGRVLFFDAETPRLDADAGSYANLQEIRLMQSLGYKVTFVPADLEYLGRHTELMQRIGVEIIHAPFCSMLDDFIRRRGNEFDLAYIVRYGTALRVIDDLRKHAPRAKIAISVADLHFLRFARQAIVEDSEELKKEAAALRETELSVLRKADLALMYSDVERSVIAEHSPGLPTATLPWVIETQRKIPSFRKRAHIGFLGGYRHAPNIHAVEYFAEKVMPLLRQRAPKIEFHVYGSKMPDSFERLAGNGVVLRGYVEHISDALDSIRLFVAPLQFGAGVKGKVLDSVAYGVPMVLSPDAAEGIALVDGVHMALAKTPDEWVEAIAELYSGEKQWTSMSNALLQFAEEKFSFAHGRDVMASTFDTLGLPVRPDGKGAIHSLAARPLDGYEHLGSAAIHTEMAEPAKRVS